jgi:4-amino-4-deoxy-L-arabinose transferase-like glycosyltransferase
MLKKLSNRLWGEQAPVTLLLLGAALMLFFMLGGREFWTQEWRWADISWQMIYSGDYLHPYLGGAPYYDKPLLSYWIMIIFSRLVGSVNEWALRLPAALAGMLAVWCTYQIGSFLVDRRTGLLAGWMLVSTYFFIFWARTGNSDMLNLAGTLLAIFWYFKHRDSTRFVHYLGFFLILAVTGLCKGLLGVIVPLIVISLDFCQQFRWRKHLNFRVIFAAIPAVIIYILPFWASTHFGGQSYTESGLQEVYRENMLRYFHPFDHEGPIYTYFIYLPIYTLPWALLFIPAVFALPKRWSTMQTGSRWMAWSTLLVFLFFTLSGSRRSYYVLPLVPFAILMTADWVTSGYARTAKRCQWATILFLLGYIGVFLTLDIIQPLYYLGGGLRPFAKAVKQEAVKIQPWSQWNISFLDAESKLAIYLNPAHPIQLLNPPTGHANDDKMRSSYTVAALQQQWPVIMHPPANTIFITRSLYEAKLMPYFKNYKIVVGSPSIAERLLHINNQDAPVAFIPQP